MTDIPLTEVLANLLSEEDEPRTVFLPNGTERILGDPIPEEEFIIRDEKPHYLNQQVLRLPAKDIVLLQPFLEMKDLQWPYFSLKQEILQGLWKMFLLMLWTGTTFALGLFIAYRIFPNMNIDDSSMEWIISLYFLGVTLIPALLLMNWSSKRARKKVKSKWGEEKALKETAAAEVLHRSHAEIDIRTIQQYVLLPDRTGREFTSAAI